MPLVNLETERSSNTEMLGRIAVAATLLILPLVFFFPAVLGKVTLAPGDGWTQIFGIRVLIGQMIAHGEVPLWNPYIFAGMPLLASIQPGALYPPTWLFAVLSPQTAMNLLVLTTYHLALAGTYLYLRCIGANRSGAMIAAVTFAFGGYMVAHLGHTNRINAAAWLPWILLAIEQLHRRANWRWVTLGALFIALQLFAGDPQMTLYTVMVAAAYAGFTLLFRAPQAGRFRFLAAAAAMSLCGVLLSMIQLLPERELLKYGERAGIEYKYFAQFSFPPRQLFQLFFPYFFGSTTLEPYRVEYWGMWNLAETCGYVGMAAWLLGLAAVLASRWSRKDDIDRLIWFWAFCAVAALLLAFGSFLPFSIHKLLYRVPVYNLFRASGRHLMEFTFAIGTLAGLGATALSQIDWHLAKRALAKTIVPLAVIVIAGVIVYRFFDEKLVMEKPLPEYAGDWSNPNIYVPAVFFILSVAALLIYARRWSGLAGAVIVAILFMDLMSFAFPYEWRLIDDTNYNVARRMADPPTVKLIKERETDFNSFRVLSYSKKPLDKNSDLLNYPNFSIVRGLQSVNGYDPVRMIRMTEMAGNMTLEGVVAESNAFASPHQGFNLLNAKYLLAESIKIEGKSGRIEIAGVEFSEQPIDLQINPDLHAQIETQATASELVIISAMGNSDNLTDGAPVLAIKLRTLDGTVIERELQAGRDTSEWAHDREDVKARIKHGRAPIAESWDAGGFQGHRYLTRLTFDRTEITGVEFKYLPAEADITISRATLFDAESKTSQPLVALNLPADRWSEIAEFGQVKLLENLQVMPRAWFANHAAIQTSIEVLQTIKTGRLKDGTLFNPAETVLLESEIFGGRYIKTPLMSSSVTETPKAEVKITRYEPHRIDLQVNNQQTGFLILSEMYYRGWDATVDGQRVPVERVNYNLRGIELPPGNHNVEFRFHAPSFRTGAKWSAFGVLLLIAGGVISRRRNKGKSL